MRRTVRLVLVAAVLAGVCGGTPTPATASSPPPPVPLPADAADPGRPGPYRTVTGEYDLAPERLRGLSRPVEMRAVVVAPRGAAGPRPLVLMLHGMHATCHRGRDPHRESGDWPCRRGTRPIPSYRGYLPEQRLLASQGYLTVSISANGVNGQDEDAETGIEARSALVRRHLAHWADWAGSGRAAAPGIVRTGPPADLSRVVLMGHSRGGEGVNRATMDSVTPPPAARDGYAGPVRWTVRGTLLVAPMDEGQNPVADVPSVTVLPGCDGDVSSLNGQLYVDATRGVSRTGALHSAVYLVGADHNFFNTEWTPGTATAPADDDADDDRGACTRHSPTRLTAAQQLRAAATYFAAAVHLFVDHDDLVRPLLDGSGVRAPSADPARVLTHALGGLRTELFVPGAGSVVQGAGRLCPLTEPGAGPQCLGAQDVAARGTAHFIGLDVPDPDRYAVALTWSRPGQGAVLRTAEVQTRRLALRLIVPPGTRQRFRISVLDPQGRRTDLGPVAVDGLPAPQVTSAYWAQEIRLPLPATTTVAAVDLVPLTRTGRAWLLDAWAWQPGLPELHAPAPPRVDLGEATVPEGDAGTRIHHIPVAVSGSGSGTVRFFLTTGTGTARRSRTWLVHLKPGDRRADVAIPVRGNRGYGGSADYELRAKAVQGALVGDFTGALTVRDEEPLPAIRLTPRARATAGRPLTWQITLSEPAAVDIGVLLRVRRPRTGPELSTRDVDPRWYAAHAPAARRRPTPARPLSATRMRIRVVVPAGQRTATVVVPTVAAGRAGPRRHLRLSPVAVTGSDDVRLTEVTGTVSR